MAEDGEIPDGRTTDIRDSPGGQAEVLLHPDHAEKRLCTEFTQVTSHLVAHGVWRQRWTNDGRMRRAPQGLMLAVSRWERVPARLMPRGHRMVTIEDEGSCVFLINEDSCTRQLQYDMNDLLLRLVGDGLWIQCWLRHRPAPLAAQLPAPPPPATVPLLTA
ncbi:hypothetical protein [Streptomyces sp. bgisy153]|uniref:hypothetical protein n=1 Tax=Streptomyces sp. bgisy153 TaxID=3413793 RepID=UPI003D71DCE3